MGTLLNELKAKEVRKNGGSLLNELRVKNGEVPVDKPVEAQQAPEEPSIGNDVISRAISNTIPSAKQFGKDMVQPFIHPIETAKSLAGLASSVVNLATEFGKIDVASGVVASLSEFAKSALGTEDAVTQLRTNYNAVRASQAVNNLPPGPASDKDIALALSGFPKPNASPKTIVSFLRGSAKLARADAAYNQFKADFISKTGSPRDLNKEWRTGKDSPELGKKVTMGDIYITAQNKNLTPEEVMDKLGIKR